jgi:hypothetical protein
MSYKSYGSHEQKMQIADRGIPEARLFAMAAIPRSAFRNPHFCLYAALDGKNDSLTVLPRKNHFR